MKKVFIVSLFLLIIDTVIKWSVINNIEIGQSFYLIKPVLQITHLKNTGAAFNLLDSYQLLIGLIAIFVIGYLIRMLVREKRLTNLKLLLYSMLISGILANLIDRIIYGGVIDYIAVNIVDVNLPIFNFADALITISITIYLVLELVMEKKDENKSNKKRR